jgi:ribose transport system substrate-binding protein
MQRGKAFPLAGALLALVVAVVLVACGSDSSSDSGSASTATSTSSGDGPTTVDVGTDAKVTLPKKGMKIGLFMAAITNEYQQQVVKGAQDAAKGAGVTVTPYNGEFDPAKQLDQIQNAMQQGGLDAVILHSADGNVLCNIASKQLPGKGVAVVAIAVPVCGHEVATGEESAEPGTLAYVGSVTTKDFITGWLNAAAEQNPGKRTAAMVRGPELIGQTRAIDNILKGWQAEHPDFQIKYKTQTDYTTPDALAKTQALLKAHDDIDLVMSVYSPDLTRGVINGLKAEGKLGKIPVADMGGSKYTFEQIRAGNIQFSLPMFPYNDGKRAVEALVGAASGKQPPRFVDDSEVGTAVEPFVITKDTIGEYSPQY